MGWDGDNENITFEFQIAIKIQIERTFLTYDSYERHFVCSAPGQVLV